MNKVMAKKALNVYQGRSTGAKIRRIRKNSDIRADELAAEIGCSPNHLYNVESGRETPSIDLIMNISKALKISMDELLFEEETQAPMSVEELKERVSRLIEAYDNTHDR